MSFCPQCGSWLPHAPPVACRACGSQLWRNSSPAAATLTVHEGRLLLVRRAQAPWRGLWCAPSGFCEFGEHPIEAAERETFEETGMRVEVTGYLGTWLSYYADDDGHGSGSEDDVIVAVAYYHARPRRDGAATIGAPEVSEVRWFGPDELPGELAPPAALPAILTAWREAVRCGLTRTVLPDRPDGA